MQSAGTPADGVGERDHAALVAGPVEVVDEGQMLGNQGAAHAAITTYTTADPRTSFSPSFTFMLVLPIAASTGKAEHP